MTTALWCVLIAGLLPLTATAIAKFTGDKKLGPKANHNPREWLEALDGYKKRAHWAQQNSFEAFPFFAAGVIVAQMAGAAQSTVDLIAVAFIAIRLAYLVCYLADWASVRTLVWTAGYVCCIALFVSPIF